ncbi:MAG: hypothetical protein IJ852_03090 [Alphaproteobacteria bacterium]|nr:hypothetical protein [Alphaproteobacteria bacterium]
MLKFCIYAVVLAVIIGGVAGLLHLYKVGQKNKTEMTQYEQNIDYTGNLGKVLVVYYSMTFHTREIADMIASATNAHIYEIKPKTAYSSPSVYMKSKKELEKQQYPALQGELPNIEDYDIVFVGGPVWWYTMATPLYSFLENVDFKGKKVVPFSTQGSNAGTFYADFVKMAQNADIQKYESFNNLSDAYQTSVRNKVHRWLNELAE